MLLCKLPSIFHFFNVKEVTNNSCKQRLSPHQRELEERLRSISAQGYQQDLNTSSYEIVTFWVLISTKQKSYLTLLLYTLALNVRAIPLTSFYLCHLWALRSHNNYNRLVITLKLKTMEYSATIAYQQRVISTVPAITYLKKTMPHNCVLNWDDLRLFGVKLTNMKDPNIY